MFHNDFLRMRGELSLSIGRVIARPDETVASKVPLAGGCSRPRVGLMGGLEHPSHMNCVTFVRRRLQNGDSLSTDYP
jgi:hypothetical protein